MAQHVIYHWKHGWIPLTHAAALSKAHGSAKGADKYVPGASAHHGSLESVRGKSAREIHAGLEPHETGIHTRRHVAHAVATLPKVPAEHRPDAKRQVTEAARRIGATDLLPASPRSTRGSMGEKISNVGGETTSTSAGLPTGYRITSDRLGHELKYNGKTVRTSSSREALQKYAHEHALARQPTPAERAAPAPGSASQQYVAGSRLQVGDRVESEFGRGTVVAHTDRSMSYKLDSGETLNVGRGTPGYDRIKKITDKPQEPVSEARRFGAAANAGQRGNVREAQAQGRAEALQGVKPQQSEMFGAHGEHQSDLFDKPAEPKPQQKAIADSSDEELYRRMNGASDADMDAILAELDRRDEKAKRQRQAAARRVERDAKREAEYDRRIEAGADPETAYADVYGVSVAKQRQQAAISQLRAQGYHGAGFHALTAAAYRDWIEEQLVAAENGTRGGMWKGKTRAVETRNARRLFTDEKYARAHASEDLRRWWDENGGWMSLADFRASVLGGHKQEGRHAWY